MFRCDKELLTRARMRALDENTSINAVLGGCLKEYARLDDVRCNRLAALHRLLIIADKHPIGRNGRRWGSDEFYGW